MQDASNYSFSRSPERDSSGLKRINSMNAQARPLIPAPSNRQMIRLEALINARSPEEFPSTQQNNSMAKISPRNNDLRMVSEED